MEVILQYHRLFPDARILVTSGSNAAVDNLGLRLLGTSMPFIRVGKPFRVATGLHDHILTFNRGSAMALQVAGLARVPVVLSTLSGCMSKLLIQSAPYDLVIVDESAQSLGQFLRIFSGFSIDAVTIPIFLFRISALVSC